MSDYAELVGRLEKSCRYAGTNSEHGSPMSACPGVCREHSLMTEAAAAIKAQDTAIKMLHERIKALVQEKVELAQLLLEATKSDLKAESALAECMAHATALCERIASNHPVDQTIGAALPQEIYDFRAWRANHGK